MDKVGALMEGVTQDVIACLVEDENISIEQAVEKVYNSEVFSKLSDRETGLYRESSSYVAALLKDELANGRLVQREV
jgi:predicted transcriptional regulator